MGESKEVLTSWPGPRFEDKGATIPVHYHSARDRGAAWSVVLAGAEHVEVFLGEVTETLG